MVEPAAVDDRHEAKGAQALAGLFGPQVRGPIALHVAAKRYLCAREPGYFAALSPASRCHSTRAPEQVHSGAPRFVARQANGLGQD